MYLKKGGKISSKNCKQLKFKKMKLTDNEKRDAIKFIEEGKPLPEKYRFLLFDAAKQVELLWNGKSDEITNVVLPFQIIERVEEPRSEVKKIQEGFEFYSGQKTKDWTNKLIWGDNKYILSSLKNGPMRDEIEKNGGIKLIYIDPPFDVGADFSMDVEIGDSTYEKKPNVLEHIAYRDTWGKGEDSFLSMIYERLIIMKDLLAEDGSIFLHCDWRLNSSIKLIMDEIFGVENFVNEIVWKRRGGVLNAPSLYGNVVDFILFYSKSDKYKFIPQKTKDDENTKKYIEERFTKVELDGRKYMLQPMVNPSNRPNCKYEYKGYMHPKNGWLVSKERMEELDSKGLLYFPENKENRISRKIYEDEYEGQLVDSLWIDIFPINPMAKERYDYPTQKPEKLLERILSSTTVEGDIVCDFFVGSGTTAAVAEKNNRKWICTDLGKFGIHTTRKRLINVQRELKKVGKDYRAFEILNLGKYQRQHFIYDGKNERDELKQQEKIQKEIEFKSLILEAYRATEVQGFNTLHGKKGFEFVSIGPVNQALSRNHVEEVINECLKNNITSVDILAFEFEMGWDRTLQEEAKDKGIRLSYKQIPIDVFDKRAVSKGEVIFYDIAYIEFKPIVKNNILSIELSDFAVFYNDGNLDIDEYLQAGKSKIIIVNGDLVEKRKDKNGNISENILTKNWHDWIDYWSVDFDYESKPEVIKFKKEDGSIEEVWTGNYVFENNWQSFRTKDDKKLELTSSEKEVTEKRVKVAVKVVDIFGNDTIKVMEVKI
jgi:adenine specific DNA methylase Mod